MNHAVARPELRAFRKKLGLSGRALAERLQCRETYILAIERGTEEPSPRIAAALCELYAAHLAHLLGLDRKEPSN
jgi:transcriptional regulator with XRE-family HTH domain